MKFKRFLKKAWTVFRFLAPFIITSTKKLREHEDDIISVIEGTNIVIEKFSDLREDFKSGNVSKDYVLKQLEPENIKGILNATQVRYESAHRVGSKVKDLIDDVNFSRIKKVF